MDAGSPSQQTSASLALRWSWVLVMACGLLLGYYGLETYGAPKHRQYQLDFGLNFINILTPFAAAA